jgi:hypothetical protein
MKKFFISLTIAFALLLGSADIFAQGPPPPPPGGHGGTGNTSGGNAPIGGGLFILMGLGAAYGSRKLYLMNKEEEEV